MSGRAGEVAGLARGEIGGGQLRFKSIVFANWIDLIYIIGR
jgi:hypothetical protein